MNGAAIFLYIGVIESIILLFLSALLYKKYHLRRMLHIPSLTVSGVGAATTIYGLFVGGWDGIAWSIVGLFIIGSAVISWITLIIFYPDDSLN